MMENKKYGVRSGIGSHVSSFKFILDSLAHRGFKNKDKRNKQKKNPMAGE
jgi:hypothetical protein